ncbi:hypothetical protein, partial [Enterococcus cecorum]|uniref:hypothetical protein n=1 Tax=Enterococcus cecorum TaxID=44008 RepID=UPI001FADD312
LYYVCIAAHSKIYDEPIGARGHDNTCITHIILLERCTEGGIITNYYLMFFVGKAEDGRRERGRERGRGEGEKRKYGDMERERSGWLWFAKMWGIVSYLLITYPFHSVFSLYNSSRVFLDAQPVAF